jgi:hypothetical protein
MGSVWELGVEGVQQEAAGVIPGAAVSAWAIFPYLSRTAPLIFSFSPVSIFPSFDLMIRKLSNFIIKKKDDLPLWG